MKYIKVLIILILAFFVTPICRASFNVIGTDESSRIVLKGNIGSDAAGQSVTVLVLNADSDPENCEKSDIMYFNTTKAQSDGSYYMDFECEGIEYTETEANCRIYIKQGTQDVSDSLIYAAVIEQEKCFYELEIIERMGEKTAVLSVENPFMTNTEVQLVIASYKEDKTLFGISVKTLNINELKQGMAIDNYLGNDVKTIKAFVWANMTTPLTIAAEAKNELDTSHKEVLIIGNSYSTDSARYVHSICESIGADIDIYLLGHAGGTVYSLWKNREDASYYNCSKNGTVAQRKISLEDLLDERKFDVIVMQNYWGASDGILYESNSNYECSYPDAYKTMAQYLTQKQPEAELLINAVWSNEIGYNASKNILKATNESEFKDLDNAVQRWSYNQLEKFNHQAAIDCGEAVGLYGKPIRQIPVGYAVQLAREYKKNGIKPYLTTFNDETKILDDWEEGILCPISSEDKENGRLRLNRDGYHLSFAGRYLAGLVWTEILTGYDVTKVTYTPEPELIQCGVQATGSGTATTDSIRVSFEPLTYGQAQDLRYIAHNAVRMYYAAEGAVPMSLQLK